LVVSLGFLLIPPYIHVNFVILLTFASSSFIASLVVGSDKVVEAALHEPEQKVITNVQCAQE